jgi:hypothetical protein
MFQAVVQAEAERHPARLRAQLRKRAAAFEEDADPDRFDNDLTEALHVVPDGFEDFAFDRWAGREVVTNG